MLFRSAGRATAYAADSQAQKNRSGISQQRNYTVWVLKSILQNVKMLVNCRCSLVVWYGLFAGARGTWHVLLRDGGLRFPPVRFIPAKGHPMHHALLELTMALGSSRLEAAPTGTALPVGAASCRDQTRENRGQNLPEPETMMTGACGRGEPLRE